jgi:hypothetical protein
MTPHVCILCVIAFFGVPGVAPLCMQNTGDTGDRIRLIDPPEKGFYAKALNYDGIPIKASSVVEDNALFIARERLRRQLKNLPEVRYNLRMAGAELHIIGKDQVTSDLPEHRHLKGKPFDGNLTVDQRTRGLGGLLTSCGEENLLELPNDRYRGRDICTHEFAHNIQGSGLSEEVRKRIREQYRRSLDKGLWKGAYAATNEGEFFAELTMWYFGTHGDLHMTGEKPENGTEGLKKYDPEAYALLDDLYSGRIPIPKVEVAELTSIAPEREKDIKSGEEKETASIRFVNQTSKEVKLYWLDISGKRQAFGTIDPNGSVRQRTFASHAWLVSGTDEKAIAIFVASAKRCIATIKEGPF